MKNKILNAFLTRYIIENIQTFFSNYTTVSNESVVDPPSRSKFGDLRTLLNPLWPSPSFGDETQFSFHMFPRIVLSVGCISVRVGEMKKKT